MDGKQNLSGGMWTCVSQIVTYHLSVMRARCNSRWWKRTRKTPIDIQRIQLNELWPCNIYRPHVHCFVVDSNRKHIRTLPNFGNTIWIWKKKKRDSVVKNADVAVMSLFPDRTSGNTGFFWLIYDPFLRVMLTRVVFVCRGKRFRALRGPSSTARNPQRSFSHVITTEIRPYVNPVLRLGFSE